MQIVFLGTGSSHGIPVIGCDCSICKSTNLKDRRLRSSLLFKINDKNIIIDVGPDFRQQVLREKLIKLDAVLITHEHKDHTAGLDDLRAFNYIMKRPIDIYAEQRVLNVLKQEYSYAFKKEKYPGAPEFNLFKINNNSFYVKDINILPIQFFHNKLSVLGYRINNVAYVTDIKSISIIEKTKLEKLKVLVISAIRIKPHIAHMGLFDILKLIEELSPEKVYLTHISHMQYSYNELKNILPNNVYPAYDGLTINI